MWKRAERPSAADVSGAQRGGAQRRVSSPAAISSPRRSMDHKVRLWEMASTQQSRTLKGHTDKVWGAVMRPDGKQIASAGADNVVRLWDVFSKTEQAVLKGHASPVTAVAYSRDSKIVASCSGDATVKLWDAKTFKELLTLKGHDGTVTSVAFSPDGKQVVTGGADRQIIVWDVQTGQVKSKIPAHRPRGHLGSPSRPTARKWRRAAPTRRCASGTCRPARAPRSLTIMPGRSAAVAYSPKGRQARLVRRRPHHPRSQSQDRCAAQGHHRLGQDAELGRVQPVRPLRRLHRRRSGRAPVGPGSGRGG